MKVAGDIRACGLGGGFVSGRGGWGKGDDGRDGGDRQSDLTHLELGFHRVNPFD